MELLLVLVLVLVLDFHAGSRRRTRS